MANTSLRSSHIGFTVALVGLLMARPFPAHAGSAFDFLFRVDSARTDAQFFLNLTVQDYGLHREELEPVLPRIRDVEVDLPVVLYLARESRRPVTEIVELRESGLDWNMVFSRVGCPHDRLFEGIDRDPGPPYGKAWGYRRKHPERLQLVDGDIRGLVQIQIGRRFTGLSPYELAQAGGRGIPVARLVAEKKGRHARSSGDDADDEHGRGKGKKKGHKKEKEDNDD